MLPELPKKNNKKEADFGLRFREWIFRHKPKMSSCTLEMKDSRGKNYISFKEITDEQVDCALRTESDKGNLIRIVTGTLGAPDYAWYRNAPAFIVVHYPKNFEIISIDNLLHEKNTHKRKSLTSLRAHEIATISIACG